MPCSPCDALRPRQSRHRLRHIAESRLRFARSFLACFYLEPLLKDRRGILGNGFAGEHVGMAANELVGELSDDVLGGESAFFSGDLGMKNDLEQDISKLFAEFFRIAVV